MPSARRGVNWAVEVLKRLKGVEFPVKKEELKERLKGLYWAGMPIERILDEVEKEEFRSPAELLHELSEAIRKLEERGELPITARRGINWAVEVLKRLRGAEFPLKKEELAKRLEGLKWHGLDIEAVLKEVEKEEFHSPAEVLHELSEAIRKLEEKAMLHTA
ncbi:MAG: DUF2795 domain-containing protein [Crenarchaeota archaeon]|nr:DUF2795 domain-containing protein [Thermoproteota archaeon]